MQYDYEKKSSIEEIRERFDKDVERFSNVETGQQSTMDAEISMELITEAAKWVNPTAKRLLDIGCGAGNYSLKMLSKVPNLDCTLVDLSAPMLDRANERVAKATTGKIARIQVDLKEIDLPNNHYDIMLAGAVMHHLRAEDEWLAVFQKLYNSLKEGGSLWISDLITQESEPINQMIKEKYGQYLEKLGGQAYKEHVFQYVEKEDTPRSINFQLDLMKKVGFRHIEILHKNACFAAFGGIK
ncbi:MAG: class I SAM-dependent methyltransferase [Bacteroidota bacterium]